MDHRANDGETGEGDNVVSGVELIDTQPYNFLSDAAVLPLGGRLEISRVWSASRAALDLETRGDIQVVSFYDEQGMMAVASRRTGESTWVTKTLPTLFPGKPDSHLYIELAFDPDDHLHVSGNQHVIDGDPDPYVTLPCCSPLQYFSTAGPVRNPEDIFTLTARSMVPDGDESLVTYPWFFTRPDGQFGFYYRNGWSEGGELFVNLLDRRTGIWRRGNGGKSIFSGTRGRAVEDTAGIYSQVYQNRSGFSVLMQIRWLQRSHCGSGAINGWCPLLYLRTSDLERFTDVAGTVQPRVAIPTTVTDATVVDPTPFGGIFWKTLVLTESGDPIVLYTRFASTHFDPDRGEPVGDFQAYVARWNGQSWDRRQITSWDRFVGEFDRPSTPIRLVGPVVDESGASRYYLSAGQLGIDGLPSLSTGWLQLDPVTLSTVPAPGFTAPIPCDNAATAYAEPVEFPDYRDPINGATMRAFMTPSGMPVPTGTAAWLAGYGDESRDYYYIRWEALASDADPASHPPPTTKLSLHRTNCIK